MGLCASIQYTKSRGQLTISNGSPSTVKVVYSVDGKLQEFRQPIKASQVLSDHPNTYLMSSEDMFVDCHVPHVPGNEELQLGQLYFIMPISESNKPLTLHELCVLAIKASTAIEKAKEMATQDRTVSFSDRRKSNRNARRNEKVDFQLALKKLG